jgi:hypothetical protein
VGSIPADLLDGPGLVDGGEELAPDVGDTRTGMVPAPSIHACGQAKERKNRQDGQVLATRWFSREKNFHVDSVFHFCWAILFPSYRNGIVCATLPHPEIDHGEEVEFEELLDDHDIVRRDRDHSP